MAGKGWLRVEQRKQGATWVLRYHTTITDEKGTRRVEHTRAIGLVDNFPTKQLARAEADRQCPNLEQPTFSGRVSFGQLAEYYLTEVLKEEPKAASTVEDRTRILNNTLIPVWGDKEALSITPRAINKWKRAFQEKTNLHNATVKKILDVMHLVFKTGIEYGLIPLTGDTNPLKFVKRSAQTDYEARTVTPEKAFETLMGMQQPERTMTLLIALTGIRISECLGLQWQDVDWLNSRIHVRRKWTSGVGPEKPKSKASKAPVPLHSVLAGFLQDWRHQTAYSRETDWIFASDRLHGKQPRTANMLVEDHLRPAAVRAGVLREGEKVRFGFHNLRHSLIDFLVSENVDPKTVQALARHSDVHTTLQVYAHARDYVKKGLEAQGKMLDRMGMVQ